MGGQTICTSSMDCPMGEMCLRVGGGVGVCTGGRFDGGRPPRDAAAD
jgi:hypothetical protein